ncbi:MAG: ABC transporter ATP-binding protein, partial [Verrucomicrobiota bacterium]
MSARASLNLLRDLIRELGWRYRVYIPAYILVSAAFLLPPQLLKNFTEQAQKLTETAANDFLVILAVFGAGIAVALWLSIYFSSWAGEWLRLTVTINLRRRLLHSLHRKSLETLDSAQRGDWLTRMSGDLRGVEYFLSDTLPEQLRQATLIVGATILFVFHSGPIALIPCSCALLLGWLNAVIQRRVAPVLSEAREQEGRVFHFFIESFEGLRTIRSFRAESTIAGRLDAGLTKLYSISMRIIRMMGALMGVNELASQIVITGCLCFLAWALQEGSLTVADVLVYPFYLTLFLNAAKTLVAGAYEWNRFFVEGGRLAAICEPESQTEPLRNSSPNLANPDQLKLDDLQIGYPDSPPLFDQFSLEISRGEILAVMGPSGCGKSTLLEVLAGLRNPIRGESVPIELCAFVEQTPYLFAGSLRDNLTLGLDAADEDAWRALEQVQLADLARERGGLETEIADRGMNLSQGQRYRLALARALLSNRPFLLLDEPFATLDDRSAQAVTDAVLALKDRQRTGVVVVTHVLPPDFADRVL